jgi:hypothetical protein
VGSARGINNSGWIAAHNGQGHAVLLVPSGTVLSAASLAAAPGQAMAGPDLSAAQVASLQIDSRSDTPLTASGLFAPPGLVRGYEDPNLTPPPVQVASDLPLFLPPGLVRGVEDPNTTPPVHVIDGFPVFLPPGLDFGLVIS